MSSIALSGNAAGAGVFTIASPNSASSFTATLPAATTTLVGTDATQTLTNKTLTSPTITGAAVSSMASSVITSGTVVATTSGTSITFSSIPSWVKRITVMFNNVGSSDAAPLLIRLGSGSTTSTGYVSTGTYGNTSNTFSTVQNTTGFYIAKAQIVDRLYALYTIALLDAATNTWTCSGSFAGSSATVVIGWTAGGVSLAGTLDRVVITSTGGTATFTAGSINILYE